MACSTAVHVPLLPSLLRLQESPYSYCRSIAWRPAQVRCRWQVLPFAACCVAVTRLCRKQRPVRGPRLSGLVAHAVVTGDAHAAAVGRWLDEFVIGQGFCPWAKRAAEEEGIRIVTSTAATPDGVLADFRAESRLLLHKGSLAAAAAGRPELQAPAVRPPNSGTSALLATQAPATTLLVCPQVEAWRGWDAFLRFAVELDEGEALTLVAFHPRAAPAASTGDSAPQPTKPALLAPPLAPGASTGDSALDASTGAGGLHTEAPVLEVRTVSEPTKGTSDAAGLLSCAPRPVLQLLRQTDLEDVGAGPELEALLVRNRRRVAELGCNAVGALLRECG
mmetsp:Transcript_13636/g.38830  ORF Transcript_13636/g.38830 Transcript_13636/m.38830 type:complete len:335 (+) Transcript_13636:163-1167(+)